MNQTICDGNDEPSTYTIDVLSILTTDFRNFYQVEPICSRMEPKNETECKNATETCQIAGIKDENCPNNGLCCFNGCVNACQELGKDNR